MNETYTPENFSFRGREKSGKTGAAYWPRPSINPPERKSEERLLIPLKVRLPVCHPPTRYIESVLFPLLLGSIYGRQSGPISFHLVSACGCVCRAEIASESDFRLYCPDGFRVYTCGEDHLCSDAGKVHFNISSCARALRSGVETALDIAGAWVDGVMLRYYNEISRLWGRSEVRSSVWVLLTTTYFRKASLCITQLIIKLFDQLFHDRFQLEQHYYGNNPVSSWD